MGAARAKKLTLLAKADAGEPVVIDLGVKSARRLMALLYVSQGAQAVVEAATAQAKALRQKYEEAIVGVLEAHGIESAGAVDHDPEKGCVTVTPAPADPPPSTADPEPPP